MVIKLVKNEIRETYRSFTPIFIMAIIGAVLTALIGFRLTSLVQGREMSETMGLFIGIGVLAIYGLLMATGIMTLIALVRIGYSSMYKHNGYRLFTYPASSVEIYVSKMIVILFWSFVTSIIIGGLFFASIAIVAADYNFFAILGEAFGMVGTVLFGKGNLTGGLLLIVSSILSSVLSIAILLFAGSVANSSLVQGRRGLITFLIMFGIYVVSSYINGMVTPQDSMDLLTAVTNGYGIVDNSAQMVSILVDAIYIIVFTFGTLWFWDNKLEVL